MHRGWPTPQNKIPRVESKSSAAEWRACCVVSIKTISNSCINSVIVDICQRLDGLVEERSKGACLSLEGGDIPLVILITKPKTLYIHSMH